MNSRSDCKTLLSRTRILRDDQEIATGAIMLPTENVRGEFLPDYLSDALRLLDTQITQKLLAAIRTHRHQFVDFQMCHLLSPRGQEGKKIRHGDSAFPFLASSEREL